MVGIKGEDCAGCQKVQIVFVRPRNYNICMYTMMLPSLVALLGATATVVSAQGTAGNNNYLGSTPAQRHIINQTQALQVINAAAQKSASISVPVNIAVADPSGLLVAFLRVDNAYLGSIDISMKKARTVSLFNGALTTEAFYNQTQPGQSLYAIEETNGGLIVFGGGVPINIDGFFIGSVGVSGGTTAQDVQCALAGVQAIGGYVPSM